MSAAVTPLQPSKDGPAGSWEQVAADALRMRQIVELLTQGHSYRKIAKELGIAYTTMLRIAPKVATFINDETRALASVWQATEFARLELASEKLLPHITMTEDIGEDADQNAEPPDPKLVTAYARLVMAKLTVLTLNRQKFQLPLDIDAADDRAAEKARMVGRFMELADKLVGSIVDAGVGSGRAREGDDDEDDLDRSLDARADNSDTIDAAVGWEDGADEDVDAPGEWRDGKFYALAD